MGEGIWDGQAWWPTAAAQAWDGAVWWPLAGARAWDGQAWRPLVGGPTYPELVLRDGPVAYWRFEETAGPVIADSSGNGHDGTLIGTAVALGVPGPVGLAARFGPSTGDDTQVEIGPGDILGTNWPGITVECWQRTTMSDAVDAVANDNAGGVAATRNWKLGIHGERVRAVWANGRTPAAFLGETGGLNDDTWHHIAFTMNLAEIRIYLDGRLDQTVARTETAVRHSPGSMLQLGYDSAGRETADCWIDEVAIYPRALTGAQIAEHHAAGGRP